MTRSDLLPRRHGHGLVASPAIVWNTVMPALGAALVLGASILPALALAGVVAVVMHALLAPAPRPAQTRRRAAAHPRAPHSH